MIKSKFILKKIILFLKNNYFIVFFILSTSLWLTVVNAPSLVLLILTFLFLTIKISPRIPSGVGLLLLVLIPIFLMAGQKNLASDIAIYSYIFLIISVITILERILLKKEVRLPVASLKNGLKYLPHFTKIIIFMTCLLAFHIIIMKPGAMLSGDLTFPINTEEYTLPKLFSSWSDIKSYSEIKEIGAQKALFLSPLSLVITYSHISMEMASKILLFSGLLIAGGTSFLAAKRFFRKLTALKYTNFAALITSLFYMFNPWSMSRIVHFFHWLAYAFTPLIFLCFVNLLKTKKGIYILLTSFLLTLIAFSPHFIFYNLLSLGSYLIMILIFDLKKRDFKGAIHKIRVSLLAFILFLIFSSVWLIPYIFISLQKAKFLAPLYILRQFDILEANKGVSLINIITLNIHFTAKNYLGYFLSLLIFVSIILNIILNRKLKMALFFSILAIISLFISSVSIFFPFLYYTIISLPFGWLFREITRIGGLLAFSYSFIFGFLYLKITANFYSPIKPISSSPLKNKNPQKINF